MDKDVDVRKKTLLARNGKDLLEELIRSFGHYPDVIPYAELQEIAYKLSRVAGEKKTARPWTWRYLRSVLNETVEPSQLLVDTMLKLGALVDGAPKETVLGERVQILALGRIAPGAVVLGDSKRCGNPACKVEFVPKVPWQKCHSGECTKAVRKMKAVSGQLSGVSQKGKEHA